MSDKTTNNKYVSPDSVLNHVRKEGGNDPSWIAFLESMKTVFGGVVETNKNSK
ncbi:MAG: hypothetical protein FWG18_01105 [Alphaproteobacteria bacterium]|nr:hypothetical protein [Alphaproteobacteria bacterium]